MKTIIISLCLLLFYACNHKQNPASFDCKCPNERVSFKKQERFPPATFTPDSVSKPIELTEDSSFIGIWYYSMPPEGSIYKLFSKNSRLFYSYYRFNLFGDVNRALSYKDFREKKYLT